MAEERRRVRGSIDQEIEGLRMQTHTHLEGQQAAERRAIERGSALRGEIESLRKEQRGLEGSVGQIGGGAR